MNDFDDHVIPYEDAVRRHHAIQEAQRQTGATHELRISDAMSHLLEEEASPEAEGPSPAKLRSIVEHEFADEKGRAAPETDESADGPSAPVCSLKERTCDDGGDASREPPRR